MMMNGRDSNHGSLVTGMTHQPPVPLLQGGLRTYNVPMLIIQHLRSISINLLKHDLALKSKAIHETK